MALRMTGVYNNRMKKLKAIFYIAAVFTAVSCASGCSGGKSPTKPGTSGDGMPVAVVKVVSSSGAERFVNAEVALTPSQQETGLMNRASMADDAGMLFVFGAERSLSFWMKNTLISLDMIFIDSSKTIVDINQNAIPLSETPFTSRAPAKYVLEVNGGYCARNNVQIGNSVAFDGY